jgi:predicted  nucleic acid-binding Zn-ribbon protein
MGATLVQSMRLGGETRRRKMTHSFWDLQQEEAKIADDYKSELKELKKDEWSLREENDELRANFKQAGQEADRVTLLNDRHWFVIQC